MASAFHRMTSSQPDTPAFEIDFEHRGPHRRDQKQYADRVGEETRRQQERAGKKDQCAMGNGLGRVTHLAERAAQLRDAVAQYHLGNMYAFGHGVPREVPDPDRMAARWYLTMSLSLSCSRSARRDTPSEKISATDLTPTARQGILPPTRMRKSNPAKGPEDMSKHIDVLLLLALPASGKSEARRYLASLSPEQCHDQFGIGHTVQLDDFPYVHIMRRVSDELTERGHPGAFFVSPALPFRNPIDWLTLIELINEDYDDLVNRNKPAHCRRHIQIANGWNRLAKENLRCFNSSLKG